MPFSRVVRYVLALAEAVLEFVANTPRAVGYVNAHILNGQVDVLLRLSFSMSSEEHYKRRSSARIVDIFCSLSTLLCRPAS
jgi:hypothetical protein